MLKAVKNLIETTFGAKKYIPFITAIGLTSTAVAYNTITEGLIGLGVSILFLPAFILLSILIISCAQAYINLIKETFQILQN